MSGYKVGKKGNCGGTESLCAKTLTRRAQRILRALRRLCALCVNVFAQNKLSSLGGYSFFIRNR